MNFPELEPLSPETPDTLRLSQRGILPRSVVERLLGSGSSGLGYTLPITSGTAGNPADATTYYAGSAEHALAWTTETTSGVHRIYVPKTGTISAVYLYVRIGGTIGTAENVGLYLRLNDATDITISATSTWNTADVSVSNNALTQAVTQSNFLELKIVTPTWVTNPTSVRFAGTIYID